MGTAPAFIVETDKNAVIALPGVPFEMKHLMQTEILPYLRKRFSLKGIILARVLHTSGSGESVLDEIIGDLEEMNNPTVGLAAHTGQVDIRITAKAESKEEAQQLIAPVESELRKRLGDNIYGADDDTLVGAAMARMNKEKWSLVAVEAGLGGELSQKLIDTGDPSFLKGEILTSAPDEKELNVLCQNYLNKHQADVCLGVVLSGEGDQKSLHIIVITPNGTKITSRLIGGQLLGSKKWALNMCLDLLRRVANRG